MSNTIFIKDKSFKPYMSSEELTEIVSSLASQLNKDYKDLNPLFVVVLNGAFIFASDLLKQIKTPCQISCIKYCSYHGIENADKPEQLLGLSEDISGRHIVIIEDIIDTGKTMCALLEELQKSNPYDVKICTLLFKPNKFTKNYPIHYIGKSVPDEFVVGYGFDYLGYGRNLPCIYQLNY